MQTSRIQESSDQLQGPLHHRWKIHTYGTEDTCVSLQL